MKVYVVGSISPKSDRVKIQDACRAIGEALAKQGHEIIVGSDHEDTVDRYLRELTQPKRDATPRSWSFLPRRRRVPERANHIPFSEIKSKLPNIELI
jgi:hypothetical protein